MANQQIEKCEKCGKSLRDHYKGETGIYCRGYYDNAMQWTPRRATATDANPTEREVAQWYGVITEQERRAIFARESGGYHEGSTEYGLTVSFPRLTVSAKALVRQAFMAIHLQK